jgi:SET domain-containing protein
MISTSERNYILNFSGEFIIEYLGEIINSKEMSKRIKRYGRDPNHKHHYLMALRSGTVIDATTHGNVGRFINHR